jgi:hypothetical protein
MLYLPASWWNLRGTYVPENTVSLARDATCFDLEQIQIFPRALVTSLFPLIKARVTD